MSYSIPIETSARHIHLCREDFEALFGEGKELTFKANLSQPGQYVAEERLTVTGPRGTFEMWRSLVRSVPKRSWRSP